MFRCILHLYHIEFNRISCAQINNYSPMEQFAVKEYTELLYCVHSLLQKWYHANRATSLDLALWATDPMSTVGQAKPRIYEHNNKSKTVYLEASRRWQKGEIRYRIFQTDWQIYPQTLTPGSL